MVLSQLIGFASASAPAPALSFGLLACLLGDGDDRRGRPTSNVYMLASAFGRLYTTLHCTQVASITEKHGGAQWTLKTSAGESETYDDVILAAPFHSTGIRVSTGGVSGSVQAVQNLLTGGDDTPPFVPPQPYVHLHVTLLATTASHPSPEYFGLGPNEKVPRVILTTGIRAREGGDEPEFNSLTYHGPVAPGRKEEVVKIFSKQRVEDEWLAKVFGGKVDWVLRKEVRSSCFCVFLGFQ